MKKRLTALLVLLNLITLSTIAQVSTTPIILEEDEAEDIDSLSILVETMNRHGNILALDAKRAASWKRKGFFRLSYTTTKTAPDGTLPEHLEKDGKPCLDGVNNDEGLYKFSNKLGVSMMWGRSFSLHKKPIANIVRFALDYTWVDLNWNQYKTFYAKDGKKYDSSKTYTQTGDDGTSEDKVYTPWGLDKHEINYGMSLGPSLTIAPFGASRSGARSLHLQGYFHVGYSGSVFLMKYDKTLDTSSPDPKTGLTGQWGIGLNTSWGVNLSFKAIGIGFEQRTAKFSYKSFDTETYGSAKTNFKQKETRIYLSYNF